MNKETIFERDIRWCHKDVDACYNHDAFVGATREMCCYIDGLSGYFAGSLKDCRRDTGTEFVEFVRHYFEDFNKYATNKTGSEYTLKLKKYRDKHFRMEPMNYYQILYSQYRCGLIHTILMKRNGGIYRGHNMPYFKRTKQFKLMINVDLFYRDFERAINTFKEEVVTNKDGLKNKVDKRYKFLVGRKYSYFDYLP